MIFKDIQIGYVDNGEETPGNIPNPAVKLFSGENSARATWCQNSKIYTFFKKPQWQHWGFFLPKILKSQKYWPDRVSQLKNFLGRFEVKNLFFVSLILSFIGSVYGKEKGEGRFREIE